MSAPHVAGAAPYYFVPAPSRHPVLVALGMFLIILGASQWINGVAWGKWVFVAGMATWLAVLFQWFRQAVVESEGGLYSQRVDARTAEHELFISRVMFSPPSRACTGRGAFVPALGDIDNHCCGRLKALWPSAGPAYGVTGGTVEPFQTRGPWPLPTINTRAAADLGVT